MIIFRRFCIKEYERGFLFENGEFKEVLKPGVYWRFDPFWEIRVDRVSVRYPRIVRLELDVIVKSGLLGSEAEVLNLTDSQRALVWIDNRFTSILRPGLHAFWTVFSELRIELVDVTDARFMHAERQAILSSPDAASALETVMVEAGIAGLYFRDGEFVEQLPVGRAAFWRDTGTLTVKRVDLRESSLDLSGQEIMTADKVSLRMNAVVSFRVRDALKYTLSAADANQSLYRETQLALREAIGARGLDAILSERGELTAEPEAALRLRAEAFGVEVIGLGIRDIILPGEMKGLMNKVTEARKAAEANLIVRREETAAIRSQANTARILDSNPTLMRLRELETLEKIAGSTKLSVVLGEKGLSERVVNLL